MTPSKKTITHKFSVIFLRMALIIGAVFASIVMATGEIIAIPSTIKLHLWPSLKAEWKACAREDWG